MLAGSPFHESELAAQKRAGEQESAEANSPMLADKLYAGALNFIPQQQMAVLSTRDAEGHRWASVVFGPKGFLEPDGRGVLHIAVPVAERGNDASHRGGRSGFLEVVNNRTLCLPDYPGNGLFNSLGNLAGDPQTGLLIPDFEHGRQIQFTASAKILWDQSDPDRKTGGTHRFVEFTVSRWLERPLSARLKSSVVGYSPYNPTS